MSLRMALATREPVLEPLPGIKSDFLLCLMINHFVSDLEL